MPLVDITNPDIVKFLVESYDKTARLRMRWNSLHKEKLNKAAAFTSEEKGYTETDVLKMAMSLGMPTTTRDHISAGYNTRRKALIDGTFIPTTSNLRKDHAMTELGLGSVEDDPRLGRPDNDLSYDPISRPLEPTQKQILYKDLPTFGRKVYLKTRNKVPPEKRYYFAESSAMGYGWRLGDSYFSRHVPSCPRVWHLTRNTVSRTGPHPDPKHYKKSDMPAVTKCGVI